MECHAMLSHAPFASQAELVVVLRVFALQSSLDFHHRKLHYYCFLQTLEQYFMKIHRSTLDSSLSSLLTVSYDSTSLSSNSKSSSSLELFQILSRASWVLYLGSLAEIFLTILKLALQLLPTRMSRYGGKLHKKQKNRGRFSWRLVTNSH